MSNTQRVLFVANGQLMRFYRGTIDTPLVRKRNAFLATDPPEAETPLKRMGTSEEVAQTILWLLGDQSSFVTGATIAVDGGWNC